MKKRLVRIISLLFAFVLCFTAVACKNKDGDGVSANVKFATAEDKILQAYKGETESMNAFRERFMGALTDECEITAFKNEYESRQIIITPESDVKSYDVSVSDFTDGENVISAENIDLRHEYYHEVSTIYDAKSTMLAGMYPDALLPVETAKEYGLNTIKAGENQGVYFTVKVPKDQKAGAYTGTVTVTLDGKKIEKTVSITVLDYVLPDTVSLLSCIPLQRHYFKQGELDDTMEMYQKHVDALKEFRLAVQYLTFYDDTSEYSNSVRVENAIAATKDPAVPCYAIHVIETPAATYGANNKFINVLNESVFLEHLKGYIDGCVESKLNLFEKAYVFMGNIIDEPDVHATSEGQVAYDRVDYVMAQYEKVLNLAAEYAEEKGVSTEVIEDILNLPNVVTGAYSSKLDSVKVYCPTVDFLQSSAARDDYLQLRSEGKDYWWYTCTVPKIPYPGYHLDDNGVSARVMSWMAKEYDVTGYLTWEAVAYSSAYEGNLYGREIYDDVRVIGDCYGDGRLFYPGLPFGIDGPVPCFRLYNLRDGFEDYEVLNDIENIYATLSNKYGATLSADGVFDEMYSMMYSTMQVYCDSSDVAAARSVLESLAVLASKGVAISDFSIGADGKVSAKVYAPSGLDVMINGASASGTSSGDGVVYTVNVAADEFSVLVDGTELSLNTKTTSIDLSAAKDNVIIYDKMQTVLTNVFKQTVDFMGTRALEFAIPEIATRMDITFADDVITSKTNSVTIYVYSASSRPISMAFSLYGNVVSGIDTVYLKPGYNEITFDRIGDLEWSRLRKATALVCSFKENSYVTLKLLGLTVR